MQKNQLIRILVASTLALIIPVIGGIFVDGWNWGVGDYVFAWVFFNILGITYTLVTHKIEHRGTRILAGVLVVAAFVFVWGMLATG